MKKIHILLLILVLLAMTTYEYKETLQYQRAFNQSLKVNLNSIALLAGHNSTLIRKFEETGSLTQLEYQALKDNQAFITTIFQRMELINQFETKANEELIGVLRSYESTYIEDQFHLFDYEKDTHKDSTDETLKGYYTKLSNELSALLMERDSLSWHQDVKRFLHSGSTFISPN